MTRVWLILIAKHFAAVLAGALIGATYGYPLHGILLALIGLIGWHLYNLHRLERWLHHPKRVAVPGGDGMWARVFARAGTFARGSDDSASAGPWRCYNRLYRKG